MRHPWTILISLRFVAAASSFGEQPNNRGGGRRLRLRQVHVVHRHGDRTPITPMKDEEYWRTTLPDPTVLAGIARGTSLLRPSDGLSSNNAHGAVGRGPFGQLTTMGLLQMVGLGERLRGELAGDGEHRRDDDDDEDGMGRLFTPEEPLHPSRVRVMSTDFPRTIQSVQALLAGLFPDYASDRDNDDYDDYDRARPIEIDLRHTNSYFIPDPHPRQHAAQLALERHLSERPHLLEREGRLIELAHRVTDALEGHLGEGADGVSFGIGEEKENDDNDSMAATSEDDDVVRRRRRRRPLAWVQLCEVLVCLSSRGLLPRALSEEDVAAVSDHVAWRWFENLGHPVLAKSSMWKFASGLIENMLRKANEDVVDPPRSDAADGGETTTAVERGREEEPMLCIYSAHDSTLIGLLCVLRLEKPVEWPEYGSALKVELIREEIGDEDDDNFADGRVDALLRRHWVRFSLNGQVLRCTWLRDEWNEPASMVPLDQLAAMIHSEHELFDEDCKSLDGSGLKYSWKDGLLSQH